MHGGPSEQAVDTLRAALRVAGLTVPEERLVGLVPAFLASRERVAKCRHVVGADLRPAPADPVVEG